MRVSFGFHIKYMRKIRDTALSNTTVFYSNENRSYTISVGKKNLRGCAAKHCKTPSMANNVKNGIKQYVLRRYYNCVSVRGPNIISNTIKAHSSYLLTNYNYLTIFSVFPKKIMYRLFIDILKKYLNKNNNKKFS